MSAKTRVVVTGVGVVTSIGIGKEQFWRNLCKGKSGIRKVTLFDTSRFERHYAGEIAGFNPGRFMPVKAVPFFGRASQFAIAATRLALDDAGVEMDSLKAARGGVILGVTIPGSTVVDRCTQTVVSGKGTTVLVRDVLNCYTPSVAHDVGYFYNVSPVNVLVPNACAAGNFSIGYACDLLRNGEIDIAIAGGAESLSRIAFQGFHSMRAMAPRACAPFDKNRKGMLLGEGAGLLVLETYQRAQQRKAHIYAEVSGYGVSCDAFHMTIPSKDGVKMAMARALKNAGVIPSQVDYINAHGTGTVANDKNESAAIQELFGVRSAHVPVSSIKSMLGHSLGAASGIEAAACCLVLENGMLPPTINFKTRDPECAIDCVPNMARKKQITTVLNNGFAFGGNNCCVVFTRVS